MNTFFPIVLTNAGLTEGDVKITNVPDGALVSSYLQGAGDAVGMLGGLDDKPAEIKANGGEQPVDVRLFGFWRQPGRLLHRHDQGSRRRTIPTW